MNNEQLIRKLIRGSILRAVQESAAALLVLVVFGTMLRPSDDGSPRYFGWLLVLVGSGFIAGVVWSYALSYQLLRSHPASDAPFWREAFHAQARLLRRVPLWYCGPLFIGGLLFVAPAAAEEWIPFLLVAVLFAAVFGAVTWLNWRAAGCLASAACRFTE